MKAEYEYSADEVLAIIMKCHVANYPPPDGMVWNARFDRYASQAVTVEAVEKETDGGAG